MEETLKAQLKKRLLEKTALETTYESESGAILRREMVDVITSVVYQLAKNYHTMSHNEMIALCARLDGILQVSELLRSAHIIKQSLKEETQE
jgi:hypothetical protein